MVRDILRFNRRGRGSGRPRRWGDGRRLPATLRLPARSSITTWCRWRPPIWSCPTRTCPRFSDRLRDGLLRQPRDARAPRAAAWRRSSRAAARATSSACWRAGRYPPALDAGARHPAFRRITSWCAAPGASSGSTKWCWRAMPIRRWGCSPTRRRRAQLLGAFPYEPNEAVLHTDAAGRRGGGRGRVELPRARPTPAAPPTVTYHMNRLQHLETTASTACAQPLRAIDPGGCRDRALHLHPSGLHGRPRRGANAARHDDRAAAARPTAAPTGARASTRTASAARWASRRRSARRSIDERFLPGHGSRHRVRLRRFAMHAISTMPFRGRWAWSTGSRAGWVAAAITWARVRLAARSAIQVEGGLASARPADPTAQPSPLRRLRLQPAQPVLLLRRRRRPVAGGGRGRHQHAVGRAPPVCARGGARGEPSEAHPAATRATARPFTSRRSCRWSSTTTALRRPGRWRADRSLRARPAGQRSSSTQRWRCAADRRPAALVAPAR